MFNELDSLVLEFLLLITALWILHDYKKFFRDFKKNLTWKTILVMVCLSPVLISLGYFTEQMEEKERDSKILAKVLKEHPEFYIPGLYEYANKNSIKEEVVCIKSQKGKDPELVDCPKWKNK